MLNCTAAPENAMNSALNPQIPKQTRLIGQIFSLKSDLNFSYMLELDDFPYQTEINLFTRTKTSYLFASEVIFFFFFIFNFSIKQWLLRS